VAERGMALPLIGTSPAFKATRCHRYGGRDRQPCVPDGRTGAGASRPATCEQSPRAIGGSAERHSRDLGHWGV